MDRVHNNELQATHSRNLGPLVFAAGLFLALLNVVSCPVVKGSMIEALPVFGDLSPRTETRVVLGIYVATIAVAVLGSVAFAVLTWRARRAGHTDPSYAVFRPYLWVALINVSVMGIVYVAAKLL